MKVLVTGANGYIGSKVVRQLCNDGADVIATDFSSEYIDERASFIAANIFEEKDDWYSFFGKPDVCLHLAWRDGFIHDSPKHLDDLPRHLSFIKNLIDRGLKRIASMGTMHEVGYYEGAIDENTPCNPLSRYGTAKNELRKSVESYAMQHNCGFLWLRAFYIYGDDDFGNSIFCKIRKSVAEGKKTFPFTSGKNKYDFIHIDELAKQISACIRQTFTGGIINCCSGNPKSLSEQVEWYIRQNNLPISLEYGAYPDRKYDSPCIYGDNKKIKDILAHGLRVLVTGCKGQLGTDCLKTLNDDGFYNVLGVDIDDVDITSEEEIKQLVESFKPEVVMHNAAWTAVDKAETCPEKVYAVNVLGTKYIADACKKVDSKLVFISTDYVFDGHGDKPFEINDAKNGLSVYGKSKSEAEDFILSCLDKFFIVRISWAFGLNGNNFVKTMLKIAGSGIKEIPVVCDQIGSVTYTKDLSKLLVKMIQTDKYGIYHATNEGFISWYEFASEIFKYANVETKAIPVTTKDYRKIVPSQANRPLNSRLSKQSLDDAGFERLPDYKDALKRYLKEIKG